MSKPHNQSHEDIVKALTVIEFALENLKLLSLFKSVTLIRERNEIESLYTNLKFLENIIRMGQECSDLQSFFSDLVIEILEVVDELLVVTDSDFYGNLSDTTRFLQYSPRVADLVQKIKPREEKIFLHYSPGVSDLVQNIKPAEDKIFYGPNIEGGSSFSLSLSRQQLSSVAAEKIVVGFKDKIKWLREKIRSRFLCCSPRVAHLVQKIKSKMKKTLDGHIEGGKSASESLSSQQVISIIAEEIIVGFEDETIWLREKIIWGSGQLQVILIVGMAGIGKTTLANKLYQDLSAHFDIHALTSVSQVYEKRKLLQSILSSVLIENDPVFNMCWGDIGKKLYECLKGKRYLFVIDDIWDIQAWNDLKSYFPNDGNGSRILMTTRLMDVVSEVLFNSYTSFPEKIRQIGQQIAAKCKGVPVKIVVVAGLLTQTAMTQDWWKPVAESIGFLHYSPGVPDLVQKIKTTGEKNFHGLNIEGGSSSSEILSSQKLSSVLIEKIVVGFEDKTKQLRDKLIRGRGQLEVIPIVGMAGIGKTTLANKLYNDLPITYHFHIRAWTSVSQVHEKRKSLRSILSSILNENDPVFNMSDQDIGEKLCRCLKGNRYLIVMDDIWDIQAWNELKSYFPNDENGSRILMTSRIRDEISKAIADTPPYTLRLLTEEESWELFKLEVFSNSDESFPKELIAIGKQIVGKCKGLPLAIVVVAGLLAQGERTQDWWRQVAESIGSSVNSDLGQIKDILALSYTHLPSPLKSCFLYLGSFPEDYEFPVKWLISSWIAEGFVEHSDQKGLEDVAENYLTNLINRSLVTVAKKRSDGGIKSCYIHDVLRDFCLKEAREKKFVQLICKCQPRAISLLANFPHASDKPYPIYSFSDCQYFHFEKGRYVTEHRISSPEILAVYRLVRVLDLRHIMLDKFPEKILELHHLKFLALWVDRYQNLPRAIFRLWNLETFILDGDKTFRVELSAHILKMVRLRHINISKELFCHEQSWGTALPASVLENLQTLSQVCPSGLLLNLLSRTPNLRKLGLHLTFSDKENPSIFPDLPGLDKLESLKFEYQTLGMMPFHIPDTFPPGLRKLTLVGSHVKWDEMEIIGWLPNLEVLKIKDNFFSGPKWETSEGGFRRLKFLKLSHMDLQQWISDSSHFPRLEHIVLNGCLDLQEIPSDIGEIPTLNTIEVYRSSDSTKESAKEIQETQCHLKVLIYQNFQEF